MKLLKSLAVLAAVIALGILVYFKVYRVELVKKAQEAQESMLVKFDLDSIKKFTLVRPDSSVIFERSVGRIWNITSPIKTEASGKPIYTLFESLNQTNILYNVDDKPKDLIPYGLDKPQFYMAMEYDEGKPDTLFLGKDTPDKTMTYVKFSSGNKVFAVANTLTDIMKKPVMFYRSRTALNVIADDIVAFDISRENNKTNRIHLVNNGVAWMMDTPWQLPGDPQSVQEILKKIEESSKMSLELEHATIADLHKYGIDTPLYVLNVQLKHGMPNKMLLVGNRLTERGTRHLWYAKQFDNDLVFTVDNSLIVLFDRTPIWFVDKQPVKFDRNLVDKILLSTEKQKVTFLRDSANSWSAVSPVDKNIPQDAVSNLFSISRFMITGDILAISPTPADISKSGLDRPKFVLEFFAGDQMLGRFLYGNTLTGNDQMTYVQTSQSPTIFLTNSQVSSSINYVLELVFGK